MFVSDFKGIILNQTELLLAFAAIDMFMSANWVISKNKRKNPQNVKLLSQRDAFIKNDGIIISVMHQPSWLDEQ